MKKFTGSETLEMKEGQNDVRLPGEIKHLLSRSLTGISARDKIHFSGKSKAEIVSILLNGNMQSDNMPLKDYNSIQSGNPDQHISLGKVWVFDENHDFLINARRRESLKNWMAGILYQEGVSSLLPKIFHFWSDLFTIELRKITFSTRAYYHYDGIRINALGNFKDLLVSILTDQAIVYYCLKIKPPSDKLYEFLVKKIFAKLSLEIDYTQYISKEKIKKLNQLLNRWSILCDSMVLHYKNVKANEIHNQENVRFQEAYFNRVSARDIISEIGTLVESILKNSFIAENMTRRLFRLFLHPEIDQEAERRLIKPVSTLFYNSKYDIKVWLNGFFLNDYFYEKKFRGCLVKSPVDFVFMLCKETEMFSVSSSNSFNNYSYWEWLRNQTADLGQDLGDPPGNNGWPAYNEPPYDRLWGDDISIARRNMFSGRLIDTGFNCRDKTLIVDPVRFIRKWQNPEDPSWLIEELTYRFYSVDIGAERKHELKDTYLLAGEKEDRFWSERWSNALERRGSTDFLFVSYQLRELLKHMFISREYQYY